MSEEFVWWLEYGVVAASLFAISGLILWFSRLHKYKQPQYLLATFFFSGGYIVFLNLLIETRYILDFPHLHRTAVPFILISFPLVYLYFKKSYIQQRFNSKELLHFIIPALSVLYFLPYYLSSADLKIENMEHKYANDQMLFIFSDSNDERFNPLLITSVLIFVSYFLGSFYHLMRIVRPEYDSLIWKNRSHTKWLFSFFILSQLQPLSSLLALLFTGNMYLWEINTAGMGFLAIIAISYIMTNPSVIYGDNSSAQTGFLHNKQVKRKSDVSSLNELNTVDMSSEFAISNFDISRKFLDLMDNERPFLTNRLTIVELAEKMQTDKEKLAIWIDSRYGIPFHELMNQFRVNYAIRLVQSGESKNKNLEQVAKICGFGNRTTFIDAFRKATGLTPSEYFQKMSNNSH